jgi:hypothetical protein
MKFVRWLGAYGRGPSLEGSAAWEISQTERQVSAEPLWRQRSLIPRAKIGLEVDEVSSTFCSGWTMDAWTESKDGVLESARGRRRRNPRHSDLDRFLAAWSSRPRTCHGETTWDNVYYRAVVVKSTATERGRRKAERLATALKLPIKTIRG